MKILSESEINYFRFQINELPETEIIAVLDEFEKQQPEIYKAVFGSFPDAIAEKNHDMANLFLDLCFDIIWIYRKAFGKLPALPNRRMWSANSLRLLDAELNALSEDVQMDDAMRAKIQGRFVDRSLELGVQTGLLSYINEEVKKYASFDKGRIKAIPITNKLLFALIRLLDELYSSTGERLQ